MATTRTPFCGYNMAQCVKLMGEYLSCYLNNIRSVRLWKCLYDYQLANKKYFSDITVKHLSEFYPQDGGENQLVLKLRHCHPIYICIQPRSRQINRRNTSHCKTTHMQCTVQRIGRVEKSHHFVGVTRMTSNLPGARQPISCYYYALKQLIHF